MIALLLLAGLALIGGGAVLWSTTSARPGSSTSDVRMHQVRRHLDVTLLRGEIKRDARRVRRAIDNDLKELR